MVGLTFGGKPIIDYASDFWLIAAANGGEAFGYVTSPWYSPELQTNIALGYVPLDESKVGTNLTIYLPDEYCDGEPAEPVGAKVVEVPFRPSNNPNARELAKQEGRDHAF